MLPLDREDFVLLRHQTAATDLYNETIITSVYYPECEQLAIDRGLDPKAGSTGIHGERTVAPQNVDEWPSHAVTMQGEPCLDVVIHRSQFVSPRLRTFPPERPPNHGALFR
jgi:hypothetical protein